MREESEHSALARAAIKQFLEYSCHHSPQEIEGLRYEFLGTNGFFTNGTLSDKVNLFPGGYFEVVDKWNGDVFAWRRDTAGVWSPCMFRGIPGTFTLAKVRSSFL